MYENVSWYVEDLRKIYTSQIRLEERKKERKRNLFERKWLPKKKKKRIE